MADLKKTELVSGLAILLRMARRSNVANLELSQDGNTVTIWWETGGCRIVDIEANSDTAIILDVVRGVLK